MIHARLRNGCSNLNFDLYQNHVSSIKSCMCGNEIEDVEHYLFICTRYANQRILLFRSLREYHPLNCRLLLFGDDMLTKQQNEQLFDKVFTFIKDTKRSD